MRRMLDLEVEVEVVVVVAVAVAEMVLELQDHILHQPEPSSQVLRKLAPQRDSMVSVKL